MPEEGRRPGSRQTQEATRSRRLGNLTTPPSVQKLQSALHAKAKEEPGYRFYLLYDKVYGADVLEFAYRCCKANKGAAGGRRPAVRRHRGVRGGAVGSGNWRTG